MQGPLSMNDLYSLSQIIKNLPHYILHRDQVHGLYRLLGLAGKLTAADLLLSLEQNLPELHATVQRNQELFKRHCESSAKLEGAGVQFVVFGEPDYPSSCYQMADPPLTLSYQGAPAWRHSSSLSVVGSREPAEDSLVWMEKEFSAFCEGTDVCIVSGGARGVDQKAHSLALRKSRSTVVVLPSGLGDVYPASLLEWRDAVMGQGGCFLSEYDYQQRMHKNLFHHRNRLIAGLGVGTLLVEARRRSGTLITAQQAAQLARPVWVVPGHPLDPHFQGSLDLVCEGAQVIRDAQDLLMFFESERVGRQGALAGVGGDPHPEHYL